VVLNFLKSKYANPKMTRGKVPLLLRVLVNGHVEVVKALLSDSRVDVNRAGPNNCTPLWMASLNGHADVVKFLLGSERKIDQTIKSVDGEDWWCGKTASEVVSALSLRGQLESETKAEFSIGVANSRAVLELFDPSKKSTKISPLHNTMSKERYL